MTSQASPDFGRIKNIKRHDVEKAKQGKEGYVRTPPKTGFYQREVEYGYGEGFIYPIIYGLAALLEVRDGKLTWLVSDPQAFLTKYLPTLMKSYYSLISSMGYDFAKVGKSNGAYNLAFEMFKGAYRDELLAKAGVRAANKCGLPQGFYMPLAACLQEGHRLQLEPVSRCRRQISRA